MLISAVISLAISLLPNHESPFLFSIGVFSTYFLVSGYRSLRFKKGNFILKTDKLIAYAIILTGMAMVLYPVLFDGKINVILLVFGIVGLVFGLRDLRLYKDAKNLGKNGL